MRGVSLTLSLLSIGIFIQAGAELANGTATMWGKDPLLVLPGILLALVAGCCLEMSSWR